MVINFLLHLCNNSLPTTYKGNRFNKIFYCIFQFSCNLRFFLSYFIDVCTNKKKAGLVILSFSITGVTLLLSGCTFKDIDKRAFVTSIGIDQSEKSDKKYNVMIKVAIPSGDPKSPESNFIILSTNTDSITDGLRQMKSQIDKELVYGHNKTILIGEKIAKSDIQPILEYFVRRPDFQKTSYISVAKPNILEVLNFKPQKENVAGSFLNSIFEYSKMESPYINTLCLFDAYRRETEDGINIAMPIIEATKKKIKVNQMALFNKNKMLLELNPKESETFRLLTTGIYNGSLKVRNKNGLYAIDLKRAKAKYKLIVKNKTLGAFYTIKIKAIIEEKINGIGEIKDNEIAVIRKQVEDKINAETEVLLTKIKNQNIDPIGFGLRFLSRGSGDRKEVSWSKMYTNLSFNIKSNVEIQGTGLIH
ncbi:Ger(x)C family spore germination protein [Bacillus sp. RG28]|uniref:Ger(X)C family spore germination protein n=1 Tax=Gottfriedia endophytica TaxID=2820819 RepID=A0A940SGV4_9BACI|nr:Ger(x)C family spore germination protein [Gottfriedia endophytica]